jgi:hypothetical protein
MAAIVDSSNNVYFTGANAQGQLGDGSTTQRTSYFAPTGAFQGKVSKVVMGGNMGGAADPLVYILTTDGDLYSAGSNQAAIGALGQGLTSNPGAQLFGKVIRNTDGKKVIDVRLYGNLLVGGAIILLEDGSLMTTGANASGQGGNMVRPSGTASQSFRYVIGFAPRS